jgi:hypothetical protein
MSELSERIRRNVHANLEGWVQRLLIEAADELERLEAVNTLNGNLIRQNMKTQVALLQAAERDGKL